MTISPQLRLSLGLVALLLSTVFVADFIGLLPRPEEQIRETRKLLGESLAVQLSSAAANQQDELIVTTINEIVQRNSDVVNAGLWREDGRQLAAFGESLAAQGLFDFSSFENLVIPIYQGSERWGEVRLQFADSDDLGLRYLGFPTATLQYIVFLGAACLLTFFVFMRRALTELNPTKVVPERVNAAFDVLAEGVLIVDERERIVLANKSFADRVDDDPSVLVGKNPNQFDWDLNGSEMEELPWRTSLKYGEHITGMPLKLSRGDDFTTFTVNTAPIEDGRGSHRGVLITFDDVTPLETKNAELATMLTELNVTQGIIEKKNRALEELAIADPLTGILNRRAFLQQYERCYEQALRKETPISVMMIDIDHFKQVNDTHGHTVGDIAIRRVAEVLQRQAREFDVVGRYGGEEFIVALPDAAPELASTIAEGYRREIANLAGSEDLPLERISVSIGLADASKAEGDPMLMIDQADRALYQAKQTGRDRVCIYDEGYQMRPESPGEGLDRERRINLEVLRDQLKQMHGVVRTQAEQLTHKSMHDELTGLPNRFLLIDRLTQAIKLSARNGNQAAIVSIELSEYQHINEVKGHEQAESMLKRAAARIEEVVRAADTIGVAFNEQALTFSRIAHNELAMLLVDVDHVESVAKILERVTAALELPFRLDEREIFNAVHCGIALFPNDGNDPDALIRNASLARAYAERGSEQVSKSAYFSRELDEQATKNAHMAAELRKAISEDGLEVFYQPKIDSRTNKLTGLEALARWDHAELGRIGPLEFITVAENIGVIDRLTDWVIKRACSDIKRLGRDDLRVSVNVSPIELHHPKTAERILQNIQTSGVDPSQIEVEITESSVLNNFDMARQILGELQQANVQVALDDFGTAYSSLNLLLEIPVDVIKIDRSFIIDIQDSPNNKAVVRAIVQMCRSMGKRILAEGVEHSRERDCLAKLGCYEIQGYLYAKPMAVEELVEFLKSHPPVDRPLLGDRVVNIA